MLGARWSSLQARGSGGGERKARFRTRSTWRWIQRAFATHDQLHLIRVPHAWRQHPTTRCRVLPPAVRHLFERHGHVRQSRTLQSSPSRTNWPTAFKVKPRVSRLRTRSFERKLTTSRCACAKLDASSRPSFVSGRRITSAKLANATLNANECASSS